MPTVIVVGSGIAGLSAALAASARHRVILLTKGAIAESNTRYAQGGIAAALFPDDSPALHAADTMRAGAGTNLAAAVDLLCADGPERVRELLARGVAFDRDGDQLARGLEAAHSRARVLHAGGDATGAAIEAALVRAVLDSDIAVRQNTRLDDLVSDGGRVAGVLASTDTGDKLHLAADAVVLASGGAGQLFVHTTNPAVATGDGQAAALRAGAALVDLEFYQFHPTSLAAPGNFLISEAVRGEGAVLLNRAGERFMRDVHPDAELAPRDVVARGIAVEMAAQGGEPVLLDATALGAQTLSRRFPSIAAACRAHGLEWGRHPVPVTPAAHYWMGGIATDLAGRTSLPGLYAIGEVACTGVHGANRLASNSLLEGLVFARRAVDALPDGPDWNADAVWTPAPADTVQTIAASRLEQPASAKASRPTPSSLRTPVASAGETAASTRRELGAALWEGAGLQRCAEGLETAARRIDELSAGVIQARVETTLTPTPTADARDAAETRNLLELGRALTVAALARRESRGAHFRTDHPATSPGLAHRIAVVAENSTVLETTAA
ncbi:L-aspartate oxidase [Humibacter ginsenosidimutans]|uniref:L-aspartate oxidase n=1 Tax=Humibacter ginsenosidimutans TaxID=2599293 RepID=A0A5B8M475_9MICO|nr:L-aspartate oxidase [Humibacter ginsenosidimutans]QDZ14390.1 L-aspartate oxidase [Humibacter ginsenosidimutans]